MSVALKVQAAPPGWACDSQPSQPGWDGLDPPAGTYFFYGTLQDPSMLKEILDLPSTPVLRPAHMVGYALKLWGQYPALVDGTTVVCGSAFDVPDEAAAQRLADYETNAYRPEPCNIRFSQDGKESLSEGFVFKFHGKPADLSEGDFNLDVWLRRMRRKT